MNLLQRLRKWLSPSTAFSDALEEDAQALPDAQAQAEGEGSVPYKVYVASKFENVGPVRKAMRKLEESGREVVYDWTLHHELRPPADEEERVERQRVHAEAEMQAIHEADCLILLCHPGMRGAFVELGAAYMDGCRVIVVGANQDSDNVFFYLDDVEHARTIDEAIEFLKEDR